jgi:diguanylate cyclase (GGDEF)-like protein
MVALAELDLHAVSPQRVLERVTGAVEELLPADLGASVILWDGHGFTVASSTADGGRGIELRVRRDGGASRWIVDHQEQVAIADTASDRFGDTATAAGVGAYVGTPIVSSGQSLGVLYALTSEPRQWVDDDLVFLNIVADRAAAAIEGARLTTEARQERERAEALGYTANALIGLSSLEEVLQTIVAGAAAAVAADHVRLDVRQPGRDALGEMIVDGPMPGHVVPETVARALASVHAEVENDTYSSLFTATQIASRVGEEVGGVIMAPLVQGGRALGYLAVVRSADFAGEDASLISAMAAQAVMAIENARLADETQEALAELSAVYEIVQAQNTEGGLDAMLSAISGAVAQALPADRVTIAVLDAQDGSVSTIVTGGRGGRSDRRHLLRAIADIVDDGLLRARPTLLDGDEVFGPRIVVPLRNRSDAVGVLIAEHPSGLASFTPRQAELANVMGQQIAVAIANALLFDETQRLAATDPLTAMNNRRQLFVLGERAFAAAQRYGRPVSAIMFDIDHFKEVNDNHGHGVGDEVLVVVSQRVTAAIRDVDIIGRYGGEEFGLILPETALAAAVRVAERLRRSVADSPIATSIGDIPVRISLGVAELTGGTADVTALFDKADAAMYRAKRHGRNQVQS